MRDCARDCYLANVSCQNQECRLHLEYEEDLNCTIIAVKKHGPMTLQQIGDRHHLSAVRIKQIVDSILIKLKKTFVKENTI